MGNKRNMWMWLLPAVVLFAAGFVVAAGYDLCINQAVYSPGNPLAILMEAVGWVPSFVPLLLLAVLLLQRGWRRQPRRLGIFLAAALATGVVVAVLLSQMQHYFAGRGIATGVADWRLWGFLFIALLLFALGAGWACRQQPPVQEKLFFFGLAGSVYLAVGQTVINGIKLLWQRTRFDDMLVGGEGFSLFTPWYRFGNGGSSFPSGHTANACGIFMLLVLCDLFPAWNRHRKLVYGVCWGYVALMAACRVMIGRHFPSDTLAAAAVMALLFWGLRSTPVYKKALLNVRSAHRATTRGKGESDAV